MDKKRIVQTFLDKGILLTPGALEYASSMDEDRIRKVASELQGREMGMAGKEDLESETQEEAAHEIELIADARGSESDSRIDYLRHFQNRFDRLAEMVKRKEGYGSCLDLGQVKETEGQDVSAVGMISEKKATEQGLELLVEDGREQLAVRLPKSSGHGELVLDETIGIRGRYSKDDEMLIAEEIQMPDIEEGEKVVADERSYVAFLSDLHLGGDDFMEDAFRGFVEALTGESAESSKIPDPLRFVVLAGDLIDEEAGNPLDLYEELARIVSRIPEHISIFAIPGETDASGVLEPQSGFFDDILRIFSDVSNFKHGSNPCTIAMDGVPVMLYHGKSLDDWASSLGEDDPCELMRQMLIRRHLAPTYGSGVPLAPSGVDPFLIKKVPSILCTGHRHLLCQSRYKGVLLLGCPSWKSNDEEKGAGTVFFVDLSTLETRPVRFSR